MSGRKISKDVFVELAEFVEKLLGASRLEKSLNRYKRALSYKNTNYIPHRLIHNYKAVMDSLKTIEETPPCGDLIAMMELTLFKTLVEEFNKDQYWNEIESDLYSTGSFVHTMALLQFISMQRANGSNIEFLVATNSNKKIADAVMYTPLMDRIDIEVKAPKLLWAPNSLTIDESNKVIENAWRKSKNQIRNGPSILLIGGIFVPKQFLAQLEESARNLLHIKKNKHIGMIIINSFTIIIDNPIYNNGQIGVGPTTSITPQIVMHVAKNPHYNGIVQFIDGDSNIPGYSKGIESTEYTINGKL